MISLRHKALIDIYSGSLGAAAESCQRGVEEDSPETEGLRGLWASILVEQGRLAPALDQIRLVRPLPALGETSPAEISALCAGVRIHRLTGDWDEALDRAEQVADRAPDLGQALRASTLVQRGDPGWMEEEAARSLNWVPPIYEEQKDQPPWQVAWHEWGMVWARVRIARAQRMKASKIRQAPLEPLQPVLVYLMNRMGRAERDGLVHRLVELSIWQSLAMDVLGDRLRALVALERALRLGLPGQYRGLFREAGAGMQFLLEAFRAEAARKDRADKQRGRAAQAGSDHPLLDYVDSLLRMFNAQDAFDWTAPADGDGHAQDGLYAPGPTRPDMRALLTPREEEILRLLAQGLSYDDIAEALIIGLTTVRWHIHGLYRKLGVSSRARAVARGKELGWL